MTRREALQIVIDHAAKNVAGVGCGIRAELKSADTTRVVEAMAMLWPDAYGHEMAQNDLFNRGISVGVPVRGRQVKKPDRRRLGIAGFAEEIERRQTPRRRADKTAIAIERGVFPRRK